MNKKKTYFYSILPTRVQNHYIECKIVSSYDTNPYRCIHNALKIFCQCTFRGVLVINQVLKIVKIFLSHAALKCKCFGSAFATIIEWWGNISHYINLGGYLESPIVHAEYEKILPIQNWLPCLNEVQFGFWISHGIHIPSSSHGETKIKHTLHNSEMMI